MFITDVKDFKQRTLHRLPIFPARMTQGPDVWLLREKERHPTFVLFPQKNHQNKQVR